MSDSTDVPATAPAAAPAAPQPPASEQEAALRVMITALSQMQARAAFSLEEAAAVWKAIQVFVVVKPGGQVSPIMEAGQALEKFKATQAGAVSL